MTFRVFVYTCALCGACMALLGWGLGRAFAGSHPLAAQAIKGMFLGLLVALGLGTIDAAWNIPVGLKAKRIASVLLGVLVGSLGGLMGGVIGESLYELEHWTVFLVLGWTIAGVLVGASIGAFALLAAVLGMKDLGSPLRQLRRGVLGGLVGGILGGTLVVLFRHAWESAFHDKPSADLWSPSASGFIALGACLGLSIGLAQVILKPAWVRVEKGYRAGRERLLSKAETSIGRAEACDIGLFGDPQVERSHARIILQGNAYAVADTGTPGGTFVNGQRIRDLFFLKSGDHIQVGNSVLVFYERQRAATV
jgi:Inner membrane component of T3SS, cytoplasmic domain